MTCRRWNWRQAHRTQLRDDTSAALFILDALDPLTDEQLDAAADDLVDRLERLDPAAAPLVLPTHFTLAGEEILLHLARPNPVWKHLSARPRSGSP